MYDSDLPPAEREYGYGYDSLHDPFLSERLLPSDYESDVLRGPYPSDVYSESRYRRGAKDPLDRYESRDISPRDVLPHRDIISLTGRSDGMAFSVFVNLIFFSVYSILKRIVNLFFVNLIIR